MNNRKVEIILGLVAIDIYQPGQIKLLCQEVDHQLGLLIRPVSGEETVQHAAAELLEWATDVDPSWLKVKLIDLDDHPLEGKLSIVYGCMIPEVVSPAEVCCKWYSFSEITNRGPMYNKHELLLNKVLLNV